MPPLPMMNTHGNPSQDRCGKQWFACMRGSALKLKTDVASAHLDTAPSRSHKRLRAGQ
jgi:hypothetical protein